VPEPVHAHSRLRGNREDRNAEEPLERGDVDLDALRLGLVHEIEHENGGASGSKDLEREEELAVEPRRVDDGHDAVRVRRGARASLEHVAHEGLIGGARSEAVGAGEIEDLDLASRGELTGAGPLLDRHAGIVRDLLPESSEAVEERRFARVRTSDQSDSLRGL
jgi:hypothetical protein